MGTRALGYDIVDLDLTNGLNTKDKTKKGGGDIKNRSLL